MKIKLAILDKEQSYINRIVSTFEVKYADKLQIYSFTDMEEAFITLSTTKIDVLLASDAFEIDTKRLPKRCGFAYFVDSADVEAYNGQRAVCKFQRAEMIYKQILSIFSETAENISGLKLGDDNCQVIFFQPVSGGVGASTMAAACAIRFANAGKRTLYLNLERFGSANTFFQADGQFDMSDVIFSLKSGKSNLPMKLESCVKRADNGVYFYDQAKVALDMLELNAEDIMRLITELQNSGSYEYIIVDTDFSIDSDMLTLYRRVHTLVWVSDGSEISNTKLIRALHALSIVEQNADSPIMSRMALVYNRFSSKTGKTLENIGIEIMGGAQRIEHATTEQILGQLALREMLDKLM